MQIVEQGIPGQRFAKQISLGISTPLTGNKRLLPFAFNPLDNQLHAEVVHHTDQPLQQQAVLNMPRVGVMMLVGMAGMLRRDHAAGGADSKCMTTVGGTASGRDISAAYFL